MIRRLINLFKSTLACHHSFFKPLVKHYLNSIMWTIEEVCSSEMAQNGVCGVLYHVMSHYSRKTGTLKIKISVRYCDLVILITPSTSFTVSFVWKGGWP